MNRWIITAIVAGVLAAANGFAADRVEPFRVGDLLIEIARERGVAADGATQASAALRADGFDVPATGLDRTLTERDVVDITRAFGLRLTTRTPQATFDSARVDSLLSVLRTELSVGGDDDSASTDGLGNDRGADPLTKGKGKKKGIRTTTDPI